MSSMAPAIVTNEEGVKLVLGASGGSRITTAVAQVKSLCSVAHASMCKIDTTYGTLDPHYSECFKA